MTPLRWLRGLWRTLTRSRALDQELKDEVGAYVDLLTEEAVARGDDPAEARRQALRTIGGVAQTEEAVRDYRRGQWIATALRDARHGLRLLQRSPSFALSVVLTLGLAIGATAAMFTAVRTIVLAPLPYAQPDRLIEYSGIGYFGEYLEMRTRSRVADVSAAATAAPKTLTGFGEPARLETVVATGDLFQLLGVAPALGRGWSAEDSAPGAEPIVTLSDAAWRERFGAQPDIVGAVIQLDGEPHRVRGVMPPLFAYPDGSTEIWIPAAIDSTDAVATWSLGGTMIGRLRPGSTIADAQGEIRTLAPSFADLFPWRMPPGYGEDASVRSLHEAVVGSSSAPLSAALAAVAFVLVIACLNVGVLMLGRSVARRTEMATRAALGASGGRLARQVFVESGVLAALGGLTGLAIAALAVNTLVRTLPADVPRLQEVGPDAWMVATVVALAALSTVLIGTIPVWRAARPRLRPAPSVRRSGQDRAARTATRALVSVEVALAVTLIIGAGLLLRSLDRLLDVSPGFDPSGVVSAAVAPPAHRYPDAPAQRAFFEDLLARVEAAPGVLSAAVTDRLPFGSPAWGSVFAIEGRPDPATQSGEWPWADYRATISAGYFSTMGVPIVSGRAFSSDDLTTSEPVMVISETLARRYWPDEDPVGRRVRFPGMADDAWIRIVGIVADTKWQRLSEDPVTALFVPMTQSAADTMSVVARTTPDAGRPGPALRAAVASIDGDTPIDRIAPLEVIVEDSARTSQFLAVLFSGFALIGILLGGIGLYGVTADAVARRHHEIAVRLAVGAESHSIVRLVVGQSVLLAAAGLAVGLAGAAAAGRLMSSLLFGVTPTDPVTFVVVPIGLLVVVAISCALPARRAVRINPLNVLRES